MASTHPNIPVLDLAGTPGQLGYGAWEYRVHNNGAAPHTIHAYAICASLKGAQGANVTPSNYTAGTPAP